MAELEGVLGLIGGVVQGGADLALIVMAFVLYKVERRIFRLELRAGFYDDTPKH